jgi:ABC-type sugar transport system ATPase subunit
MNDIDPADRDVAVVFQNYALYPHMTVADNLSFGLRLRGMAKSEIASRTARIAAMLGITELLKRRPAQLSGGQRQRVALGRALVREPQAYLLDEPLSNLDAKLRTTMRTELIKLHQTLGTTIVHVTHDQVEAMTMGERICIMKDGEIVQVGAPMEVYRNPVNTFVAGFLASPPMNLVSGQLMADGGKGLTVSTADTMLPLPPALAAAFASHGDKPVIVGLRPEDFYLRSGAARRLRPVAVTAVATEVLGPEVIVVARLGAQGPEIMIRAPRDFMARPGEALLFHYDVSQIQIFDPSSGRALKRPATI